jgi:putative membrane protein
MGIIVRLFANAIALWLTVFAAQKAGFGISLPRDAGDMLNANALVTAVVVSIVFAVVNAVVRPVLKFATAPLNCLTLGLFTFVLNALLFWAVGSLNLGFEVKTFVDGLVGSIAYSVISALVSFVVADRGDGKGK